MHISLPITGFVNALNFASKRLLKTTPAASFLITATQTIPKEGATRGTLTAGAVAVGAGAGTLAGTYLCGTSIVSTAGAAVALCPAIILGASSLGAAGGEAFTDSLLGDN